MALSSCSGFLQLALSWAVAQNAPASSLNLNPSGQTNKISAKINFKTGGPIPGGTNEFFLQFVTIAPGGSATINLQNVTDVLGFTGIVLARLKELFIWLLSPTNDATNGTNASSVTVGNAPAAPFQPYGMNAGGTFTLNNSQPIGSGDPGAVGQVVNAGAQNIKLVNNDLVNSACVLLAGFGSTT